jgi:hypothetical protein
VPAEYRTKQVIFHPYLGYVNHPDRTDDPLLGSNNHGFQDATLIFKGRDRDAIFVDDCWHYSDAGYELIFGLIVKALEDKGKGGSKAS